MYDLTLTAVLMQDLNAVAADVTILMVALMTFSAIVLTVLFGADHLPEAESDVIGAPAVDVAGDVDLPAAA